MDTSIVFDRIAGSYDATRGGMERGRHVAAAVARLLPADGPVLEVGVGTGLIAAGLAELGRPPLGIDLSVPMLHLARPRLPGRLAVADALRLPVGDGALAGAYLIHVLHLVADVPATLAEVHRVLRPGGVLAASAGPTEVPDGDVHTEMEAVRAELGGAVRQVDEGMLLDAAAAAGFTPAGRHDFTGRGISPRDAADLLEARSMSWTWAVPDDVWAARIPAVVARIRALPDQDTIRPAPGPGLLSFHRT
jgi:SAM-dependent methyltransferase